MMQSIIIILCTQNPAELVDLVKMNILNILNDPKARKLQNRVDKYIKKVKQPKIS